MASFQIATIYKDLATLRGYEKCGLIIAHVDRLANVLECGP